LNGKEGRCGVLLHWRFLHNTKMRALFISDLHLSETDAATHAKFLAFARGPARAAQRLYIMGDLFHQWLGDAQVRHDAYATSVVHELKSVSESGCDIALLVGNRDFMIGADFCKTIGARLIDGPTIETLGEQNILLLHGDELCTDDVAYQRARRVLRHPLFKPAVAPLPFFLRMKIAQALRRKSAAHKRTLRNEIMDVTQSAVNAMFQQYGVTEMIHGHTHRPAIHTHHVGGKACTRTVLHDWQGGTQYLQWEAGAFSSLPW
jgi:UDP-2,3-diacylglucosamine hydrolase